MPKSKLAKNFLCLENWTSDEFAVGIGNEIGFVLHWICKTWCNSSEKLRTCGMIHRYRSRARKNLNMSVYSQRSTLIEPRAGLKVNNRLRSVCLKLCLASRCFRWALPARWCQTSALPMQGFHFSFDVHDVKSVSAFWERDSARLLFLRQPLCTGFLDRHLKIVNS